MALVPNPIFNPFDPACAPPPPGPFPPPPPPPQCIPVAPGVVQSDFTGRAEDEGEQSEIQYIHRFEKFNVVLGYANTTVDSSLIVSSSNPDSLIPSDLALSELEHERAYLYSTIAVHSTVDLNSRNFLAFPR